MSDYRMFTVRIMLNQALKILNRLVLFAINESGPDVGAPLSTCLFSVELNEPTGCYVISGRNRKVIADPRNDDVAGIIRYELEEMVINESVISDNFLKMRD